MSGSLCRNSKIQQDVNTEVNAGVMGKNKGHLAMGAWPGVTVSDKYSENAASYIYEVWVRKTDLERAKEVCSL